MTQFYHPNFQDDIHHYGQSDLLPEGPPHHYNLTAGDEAFAIVKSTAIKPSQVTAIIEQHVPLNNLSQPIIYPRQHSKQPTFHNQHSIPILILFKISPHFFFH